MIKLYKESDGGIQYAEAWVQDGTCTFHWGVVGEQGNASTTALSPGTSDEDAIESVLRKSRADGFSQIPLEDQALVILSYKTEHEWGDADDLEKRHLVEETLNECLGWTGNGHCDGGDIGTGEMSVFSVVVDVDAACQTIFRELGSIGLLSGATIRSRSTKDQEAIDHFVPEELATSFDEPEVVAVANQEEWELATNPESLRAALPATQLTDRKCRLYGVGCCRRIWDLFIHEGTCTALEYIESLADGTADPSEFDQFVKPANEVFGSTSMMDLLRDGEMDEIREMDGDVEFIQQLCDLAEQKGVDFDAAADAAAAADTAMDEDPQAAVGADMCAAWAAATSDADTVAEQRYQCELVRCIFGSPFVQPKLDPAWRTSAVASLAAMIYESRDFSQMPMLRKRLIESGCNDESILSHCDDQHHSRGCWVVDWCRSSQH